MKRPLLLLGLLPLACAAEGLVVDVKLGYLAARTRHYESAPYIAQVPGPSGTTAVGFIGFFPDGSTSNGNGLRLATALSGRSRLTWYAEVAAELLADEQGDIDYGRKEGLIGGGLQFTLAGRLALRGGIELGYADLNFDTTDRYGNYVEGDGTGQSTAVKIGLEQGFDKHVIGFSVRGAMRHEEINNPYNHVSYEDERVEVLLEVGFRL